MRRLAVVLLQSAETAEHFTCTEAQEIADILAAGGEVRAAKQWLKAHAAGDTYAEDAHYELGGV